MKTAKSELMKLAKKHNLLRLSAVNAEQGLALVKKYHKLVEARSFPKEWYVLLK